MIIISSSGYGSSKLGSISDFIGMNDMLAVNISHKDCGAKPILHL